MVSGVCGGGGGGGGGVRAHGRVNNYGVRLCQIETLLCSPMFSVFSTQTMILVTFPMWLVTDIFLILLG